MKTLIIGSPNSGKSLLFNRLTGLNQKVANYPGITVDCFEGASKFNSDMKFIDLPGIQSLKPISTEEKIAIDAFRNQLQNDDLKCVVYVLDGTRIEKGLYLGLQIAQECHKAGKPILFAANMLDTLKKHKLELKHFDLSKIIGIPVIPVSAKTGDGIADLQMQLTNQELKSTISKEILETEDASALRKMALSWAREYGVKGDLIVHSQSRLDSFFLHSWMGGALFLVIMYLIFQSIFTFASPAMDAVEGGLEWLAGLVLPHITNADANAFVSDAIFGGVGAFLVFIPQIFILTFIVGLLEDSGYLARAAVICHKPLRYFGLTGKSFVPMLSGVACAIPGIYAARTIDSPKKRWLTYFAIPLMPCAARLPVYALLIAAFIPTQSYLGGVVGLQGLAMFILYFFGIFCGLLVTAVLSRTNYAESDMPFVLEMPPFRTPSWFISMRNAWNRSKHFVTKAGTMIFIVTVVIWLLGYFPNHGTDLSSSWLGTIGQFIGPIFEPLGLDWKYGVAIITSFLAREVFVGTLGTMLGIEGADENIAGLADQLHASGLTFSSGMALIVFFAIAMQCVSTLAILHKESGSWKLPVQMFIGYSLLAYILALITRYFVMLF